MPSLTIDCDNCFMRGTDACSDCVVTFICDRDPDEAVIFDVEEERALRVLGRNGLLPPLRHQSTVTASQERSANACRRQDWAGGGSQRTSQRD